ncbi:MAG: hypothetical protein OXE99_13225 [Cellvibrionales bacterium]|nr:hypothetical protein [Cellvibrionales bacterium]
MLKYLSVITLCTSLNVFADTNENTHISSKNDYLQFNQQTYSPLTRINDYFPTEKLTFTDSVATSDVYVVKRPSNQTYANKEGPLTIGTYNVLYDGFLFYNQFDKVPNFDWSLINPQDRLPKVISRIQNLNADLLCTQEMSEMLFVEVLKAMPNFSGIFVHSQGADRQGVALFINQDRFDEIDLSNIHEKNNPNKTHKSALYAKLVSNKQPLAVACGHLPWYESWNKNTLTDQQQTEDILAFLTLPEPLAMLDIKIWLGDFNTTSSTIRAKAGDFLDKNNVNILEDDQSYNTCFDDYEDGERLYSIAEKIDHILYESSRHYKLDEDPLTTDKRYQSNLSNREVMLSKDEPSDHLPVTARLTLSE